MAELRPLQIWLRQTVIHAKMCAVEHWDLKRKGAQYLLTSGIKYQLYWLICQRKKVNFIRSDPEPDIIFFRGSESDPAFSCWSDPVLSRGCIRIRIIQGGYRVWPQRVARAPPPLRAYTPLSKQHFSIVPNFKKPKLGKLDLTYFFTPYDQLCTLLFLISI